MQALRIPAAARPIIEARRRHKKPDRCVIVTDGALMVERFVEWGFPTLLVSPGAWNLICLRDLDVVAFLYYSDALGILASLDLARPRSLAVILGRESYDVLGRFADWLYESRRWAA